jgi:hypothetical protein
MTGGMVVGASGGSAGQGSQFPFNALFYTLGQIGSVINQLNISRGAVVPAFTNAVDSFYANQPALVDSLYSQLSGHQTSQAGYMNFLTGLAQQTVISTVNQFSSQINRSASTAVAQLIALMAQAGQTVARATVQTSVYVPPTNVGDASLVYTTFLPNGLRAENAYPEVLTAVCVNDGSPGGGAAAGSERIQVVGQQQVTDRFSFKYPGGSGVLTSLTAVNASLSSQTFGGGNWLANGDFSSFQSNVPTSWRVTVGVPGSTILQGLSSFDSGSVLNFVGGTNEQTGVQQIFGIDNAVTPRPLTLIAVNAWVSLSALPASGVLELALVDGNGNVINDAQGAPNTRTLDLTAGIAPWGTVPWGTGTWGLNAGYGAWGGQPWGNVPWGEFVGSPFVAVGATFRTPSVLPASVALRIRLVNPLSAGVMLSIDRVAATLPTQLYPQGPSVAIFSGPFNLAKGDSWQLKVTNNGFGVFQTFFDQVFGMKSLGSMPGTGLLLPSSFTPTIPNGLFPLALPIMATQGGSSGALTSWGSSAVSAYGGNTSMMNGATSGNTGGSGGTILPNAPTGAG